MPFFSIILGTMVELFEPKMTVQDQKEKLIDFIPIMASIVIATFIAAYLAYALMQISAERLSFKLRAMYLAGLMKQEVEFFELQQIEALPSKMSEYFTHISEGTGEKTGQLCMSLGAMMVGLILGVLAHPYLGLAYFCYLPLTTVLMRNLMKLIIKYVMQKMGMSAKLGAFTEELLSSLKLIISFGKEKMKLKEYETLANISYQVSKKSAIINGVMGGAFMGIMTGFSCFAWTIGFAFIKHGVENPMSGKPTEVKDIVMSYQAMMFGMFTVI